MCNTVVKITTLYSLCVCVHISFFLCMSVCLLFVDVKQPDDSFRLGGQGCWSVLSTSTMYNAILVLFSQTWHSDTSLCWNREYDCTQSWVDHCWPPCACKSLISFAEKSSNFASYMCLWRHASNSLSLPACDAGRSVSVAFLSPQRRLLVSAVFEPQSLFVSETPSQWESR